MKQKKGICIDCPPGTEARYLTAKRCSIYHYPKHRQKINANKKNNILAKNKKLELNVFFASQILQIPKICENCEGPLNITHLGPRAAICHIVPKSDFKSVATHPKNRWFGCIDCHDQYDRKGHDFQEGMNVARLVIERFKEFKHLITPREAARLPAYLYNIYYGRNEGTEEQSEGGKINSLV